MRRWPVERSYRHQEVGLLKMAHHRLGAAQLAKLGEQMEQPRLHFFIGIEANPAIAAIRQPGRQRHPQLASRRLLPLALMQPQLDLVKFSLAHDPGQAEQQTVMIGARIVDALAIGDQHAEQRAQFQELMPIVVVACQPRGIQTQHQPRLPEADLGDQPLEAAAAVARCRGLPEIVINDLNPFLGPAEQGCAIDQPVLQLGALLMLTDLAGGRLAHVNIGQLGAMRRRHLAFQIEQHVHRDAPRSDRRRRLRPALAGVAVPPASPAVVVLSVSSSATISAPRSAVDPATPARTAGSAVWPDVSSNLSPEAESLARTYSAKGSRVRTDTSGRSRFGLASQAETLRSVAFCGTQRCRPSGRTTRIQPMRRLGPLALTSSR